MDDELAMKTAREDNDDLRREMKKTKEYKISSTLFYLSAVLFYLAAIINIVGGNNTSIGVVWICLGSTFLCLGSAFLKKSKENDENKEPPA